MKKPSARYQPTGGSTRSFAPGVLPDPSFNAQHFNDLIQNRGILFTHTKALPCPNVQDVSSMIHVPDCQHPLCWNGYLQVDPVSLWGYFNNDGLNKLYEIQGEYNENIAVITIASEDTKGAQAEVHPFDQLESQEYRKRVYELVEANPTGIDRLKYKAIEIFSIFTKEREFTQGVDYVLENGKVRWVGVSRPGYDQAISRGEVFSIAYYIRPVFFVHHVMKELRATQEFDMLTGLKKAVRMPQHIMCLRELITPDKDEDTDNKTSKHPRSGILPPR